MTCRIKFSAERSTTDPHESPVIIIGQAKNLSKVGFKNVAAKLQPRVTEEVWTSAVSMLNPSPTDAINLYLNRATVAALPTKCSRHNAPARPHAITRIVKSCTTGQNETILIVCDYSDIFSSGCAVSRAYPLYNRKTNEEKLNRAREIVVEFICVDQPDKVTPADLAIIEHAAYGIQLAQRISDTPCNEMYTDKFIEEIIQVGQEVGVPAPLIIQGEELREKGFGGIYGVGKAAVHQPALVVLSHKPAGATKTVAWVGKGIVYDTGGLSIKDKTSMPGMKRDCGGAAGILGAFYAAVRQGFKENLHAIFCLAENSVSDRSTRPDDVHTLYSGRTVEINNTDAEGRLVLADGVVFANRDLHADIIVDMATLTSAQGVATGKYHAAHITNDEDWETYCKEAGQSSGDLSFPLVYCPELHFSEFTSAVADMKNSVANRNNACSSCAGLFVNAHLGFDFPGVWLHIDMASPVHSGERTTGYGVALLNALFGKYSTSALLNLACPISDEENGEHSNKNKKKRVA